MKTSLIIITSLIFLVACTSPGKYDDFAKCLSEKGVVMYGTETCSFCQQQKQLFEGSFQQLTTIDCNNAPIACANANIKVYPTWRINNTNYDGLQQLTSLSSLTGCEIFEFSEIDNS